MLLAALRLFASIRFSEVMTCGFWFVIYVDPFRLGQWVGFKPQRTGGRKRIYSGVPPPRPFIATAMDFTVMGAAQGHRKLIAHLATERTRWREAQVVSIRRPPTANQTRLYYDMPDMIAVAKATRFGE